MSDADRGGPAPLVVVGPTASGKSALALELARRTGAEIVSVDSMSVYRGMDIGTAKPTAAERATVAHHLVDIVDPSVEFTVGEFQRACTTVLDDLRRRGRPAVLVGGTGLYVRAVVDDLSIPGRFPDVRAQLEAEPDTAALHDRLAQLDPLAATRMEPSNRRRVVRALEVTLGSGRPFSAFGPGLEQYPPRPFRLVGLRMARDVLDARIAARLEAQLAAGWLDEVRALRARPGGLSRTAAEALGYRELGAHLDGHATYDEAVAETLRRTRRFARRQERWFRRDPRITWFDVGGAGPVADDCPGADGDDNSLVVVDELLRDWAPCT
ncbi:MAG: tRNA (adenosine(37)-N6)-dimethylallyltransferase MiaA [Actinomycetota bacterium]|nr:tRNA (adenosine(37)-N6)-dimethylallyltransferase MiaA [Actinomycetota bacterium]